MERPARASQKAKEKGKNDLQMATEIHSKNGAIIASGIHTTPRIVGASRQSLQERAKEHGAQIANQLHTGHRSVGTEMPWTLEQ